MAGPMGGNGGREVAKVAVAVMLLERCFSSAALIGMDASVSPNVQPSIGLGRTARAWEKQEETHLSPDDAQHQQLDGECRAQRQANPCIRA